VADDKKKENVDQEAEDVSRRKFIKNTGIATGGLVGGAILGGLVGNPFRSDESGSNNKDKPKSEDVTEALQFFKRKEDFDALAAATEVIFPEDDNGPGAIGLGAPYYIDKQLASGYGKNTEEYRKKPFQSGESPLNRGDVMIAGIRKLNQVSETDHDEVFKDLEEDIQIEILESFEAGEVDLKYTSSATFFALLRQLTLEGCFGDPMYGGNKNMEGWKMKQFPGAQMSNLDVLESDEFVEKEPLSLSDHISL